MNIPGTYLDREERLNPRYFFVSYSHADKEDVYHMLNSLYDSGVNYWFDVDLVPGDIWNERVESIINNKYCVGAFLFLSVNSLASNAVNKEVECMLSLRDQGKELTILPIIMDYKNPNTLYYNAVEHNPNVDENTDKFRELTRDNIWVTFEGSLNSIMAQASKCTILEKPWSSDGRDVFVNLNSKTIDGMRYYLCGTYPFDKEGLWTDIEWKHICRRGNLVYYAARYCIDFVKKEEINSVLHSIRHQLLGKEFIHDVVLMSEELIRDFKEELSYNLPTDYADQKRQQLLRVFWVKNEECSEIEYSIYNSLNAKLEQHINLDCIEGGIRPILIINHLK